MPLYVKVKFLFAQRGNKQTKSEVNNFGLKQCQESKSVNATRGYKQKGKNKERTQKATGEESVKKKQQN